MSGATPAAKPLRWLKTTAIYISAALLSITVLPATVVGLYYANPQSFGAVITTALDYSDSVRRR